MESGNNKTTTGIRVLKLCFNATGCPTVEVNDNEGTVSIKDDNGGSVKLTKAEWAMAARDVQI